MKLTALEVMSRSNATFCYTQSDEINLVIYSGDYQSQVYFNGRRDKIITSLASITSVVFNKNLMFFLPEKVALSPTFDCRAFNVPTIHEACNYILHRQQDCERNSILQSAEQIFFPKEMFGVKCQDLKEMMLTKVVDWNKYYGHAKYGTFWQKARIKRKFSTEEISKLPEKHNARENKNLEIERIELKIIENQEFSRIRNRTGVVFEGEKVFSY